MANEVIGLSFEFDADNLRRGITESKKALNSLTKEQNANISAYADWKKSIDGVTKYLEYQAKRLDIQKKTLDGLRQALEKAKASESSTAEEIRRLTDQVSDAERAFNLTQRNINIYTERLSELKKESAAAEAEHSKLMDSVSLKTQALASATGNFFADVAKKGIQLAVNGFQQAVQGALEFEVAFAKVEKTVDGTRAELGKLEEDLIEVTKRLPASFAQVAEVASLGGQLGLSTSALAGFSEAMLRLADSTNISAEEGAQLLAQYENITNFGEDNFGRIASVLVRLGNTSATTEKDILAMAQRLASVASEAGLSATQILALSATMASVGIEAEAGASSMQKFISSLALATQTGENLSEIASVAGMTGEAFKQLFQKDALSAITAVIDGLSKSDEKIRVMRESLGVTEVRLTQALSALSGASDLLKKSITTASAEWEAGTALIQESSKLYDTTAQKLERMKSNFGLLGSNIGKLVTPALGGLADVVNGLIDPMGEASTKTASATAVLDALRVSAKGATEELKALSAEQKALARVEVLKAVSSFGGQFEAYGEEISSLGGALKRAEVDLDNYKKGFISAVKELDPASADLITSYESALDFFSGYEGRDFSEASGILTEITKLEAEVLAKNESISAQKKSQAEFIKTLAGYVKDEIISVEVLSNLNAGLGKSVAERLAYEQKISTVKEKALEDEQRLISSYEKSASSEEYLYELLNRRKASLESSLKLYEEGSEAYEKQASRLEALNAYLQKNSDSESIFAESVAKATAELTTQLKQEKLAADSVASYVSTLEDQIATQELLLKTMTEGTKEYAVAQAKLQLLKDEYADISPYETFMEAFAGGKSIISAYGTEVDKAKLKLDSMKEAKAEIDKWLTNDSIKKSEADITAMTYASSLLSNAISETETTIADLNAEMALTPEEKEKKTSWEAFQKSFKDGSQYIRQYGTELEKLDLEITSKQAERDEIQKFFTDDSIKKTPEQIEAMTYALKKLNEEIAGLEAKKDGLMDTRKVMTELAGTFSVLASLSSSFTSSYSFPFFEGLTSALDGVTKATEAFTAENESFLSQLSGGVSGIAQAISGVWSTVIGMMESDVQKFDEQLSLLEEETETALSEAEKAKAKRVSQAENEYASGEISYKEFLSKKEKADSDYEKTQASLRASAEKQEADLRAKKNEAERKAFENRKALAISDATLQSAVAVMKAWATLGPVSAGLATAAIAGLLATQVALISAEKFVPQYAKGGVFTSPHLGIFGEDGAEAVVPLEKNTEWIDLLAEKIHTKSVTNNTSNTNTDNRQFVIKQEISSLPVTKREVYLQTRRAIRDGRPW